MKKVMPAVFFQKKLSGAPKAAKVPERLELFENELREVVGGRAQVGAQLPGGGRLTVGEGDGAGGLTTYSGSAGWADVMQADDCTSK
jgi:hypothetical protein